MKNRCQKFSYPKVSSKKLLLQAIEDELKKTKWFYFPLKFRGILIGLIAIKKGYVLFIELFDMSIFTIEVKEHQGNTIVIASKKDLEKIPKI